MYVSNSFRFSSHKPKIAASANSILGRINCAFVHKEKETMKLLYTSMVRPRLKYAVQSWSPYFKKDIFALEQVQRRANRLISELSYLTHEDRLKSLQHTTLEDRRISGDLIPVYKLIHGIDNVDHIQFFTIIRDGPSTVTRGHQLEIKVPHCKTERRKTFFSIRVISKWNKLPPEMIFSPNVNAFKSNYDNHIAKSRAGTPTIY